MAGIMKVMVLVLVLSWAAAERPLLKKCCPLTQQFNSKSECVPSPRAKRSEGAAFDPWWWFPTALALLRADNATVAAALKAAEVQHGAMPQCEPLSKEYLREMGLGSRFLVKVDDDGRFKLDVTKRATIHDGSLASDATSGRAWLPPEDFCTDVLDSHFVAIVCPCRVMPCVRKCCPDLQVYNVTTQECEAVGPKDIDEGRGEWTPLLENATRDRGYYRMVNKSPQCDGGHNPFKIEADLDSNESPSAKHFKLVANGSLQVTGLNEDIPRDEFCGDYTPDGREVVLVCYPLQEGGSTFELVLYATLLLLSALVLLAGVLIQYLVLRTPQQHVHSKAEVIHSVCLMVAYLALVGMQLSPGKPDKASCQATAFIIQWSFLAAFFWLNVMCIDISWAFSGFRSLQGSVRDRDRRKFLYYSLYAWGSPTIISIVTAVMEFSEAIPEYYIKPDFGVRACWFKEKNATFAYFYGPMAILLLGNLLLFVFTAAKIIIVRRDTAILHENGRQDRQRFVLYAKLFLLMGLTWVTEIISWAEGSEQILWYITDFINLLRAVFIFIIFCCKPKVFTLLRQRLHELMPCWCPEVHNIDSKISDGRKTSSSTQKTEISLTPVNGERAGDRRTSNTSN